LENKRAEQILPGSKGRVDGWRREGGGKMAHTMYTHMNKCKNNKKSI
jgi:hypothetical protein